MSTPDNAWQILTSDVRTDMSSHYVSLPDDILRPTQNSDNTYDINQNKVLLMNDRFGHYRTFLSLNKGAKTLVISPRIKPIVKLSESNFKIDKESIYELFQFGYILNEKTPIKEISQIPPHSLIEINLDNLKIYKKRYYSFSYRFFMSDFIFRKI